MPRYMKNIEQQRALKAYQYVEDTVNFRLQHPYVAQIFDREIFKRFLVKKLIKNNDSEREQKMAEVETFLNTGIIGDHLKGLEKVRQDYSKEYKSYVKKIPMMIKNNGLTNAFAFVLAKAKDGNAYELIDNQVRDWFGVADKSFVKYLITLDSVAYRRKTLEVIVFFSWLKRFAEGLILDPEQEVSDAN